MCGIVGYVGTRDSVSILIDGLERLEYRGYDSAGVAVATDEGLSVVKAKGKVGVLRTMDLPVRDLGTGIGHTRWATHGVPSDVNAHPHTDESGRIAVVHNGIIENATGIRERLEEQGIKFRSDTDTEVLAHLVATAGVDDLGEAVRKALGVVEGTYGLAVIDRDQPGTMVVARNGSPVVLGYGDGENFVASDVAAIVRHTQQVVFLEDGEMAVVRPDGVRTYWLDSTETSRRAETVGWGLDTYDKGDHSHFMRKEIFEQPEALRRTLSGRLDHRASTAKLGGIALEPRDVLRLRRVRILGCGSAYYAGRAGAGLVEQLARIPAEAEPASEFRYRNPIIDPDTLYVAVSQSGETLDTLRAVQEIKRKGGQVLGVVNVVGSTIARECNAGIYLHAGPEISVASTKAFTCTVAGLALLALHLGRVRDLGAADGDRIIAGLDALPDLITTVLATEDHVAEVAERFAGANSAMFVGRVNGFPVALEGAQKLKEVSYVHAEAYPSAELKHGPLALIGPEVPSVVVVPDDHLVEKNLSTVAEIRSRQGPVVAVGHSAELEAVADEVLLVPKSEPELDPILLGIPLQLLAYHTARCRGVDIDQPRNLAKSVTVE
ncbi:MAG TPA: glutamine--fructose-6-phosphate transaminase (isomerizing) [Acidimicrobiales bacterium]|nr:glutamine--fructose-6-phosphate transaminase (isomerizing) [Acidimicrobiales bacterium]